jgi:hypothetical protein
MSVTCERAASTRSSMLGGGPAGGGERLNQDARWPRLFLAAAILLLNSVTVVDMRRYLHSMRIGWLSGGYKKMTRLSE